MMAQLCAQTFADCRRSTRSRRSGKDLRAFALERLDQCQPFQPFSRGRLGRAFDQFPRIDNGGHDNAAE